MNSRDFVYWLQGFMELADPKSINEKQTELIKRHLNMVFFHEIDPSFGEQKEDLTEIHEGLKPKLDSGSSVKPSNRFSFTDTLINC